MYLQKVTSKKRWEKKYFCCHHVSRIRIRMVPKCHESTTLSVLFASGSNSDPDPHPWTKFLDLFRKLSLWPPPPVVQEERMLASLRKREEEVKQQMAGHLRDRDKERENHQHLEAGNPNQWCGSGIRCLFYPGIRDVEKVRIRIRDEQPGSYFRKIM